MHQIFVAVQLAALVKRASPSGDRCQRIGGNRLSFAPLVVVVDDRAVCRFVFEVPVRGDKNAGHHRKTAGGGGNQVAHDVSVVVFARPDDAAFRADDLCRNIVNECIAVVESSLVKACLEFFVEDLLEQELEGLVVVFGNGILAGEPDVLLNIQCVGKAAAGKRQDGVVAVVHCLQNAGSLEIVDRLAGGLVPSLVGEDQLRLAGTGDAVLDCLVNVAVGVACDGDRLFPAGDDRLDLGNQNRRAENCAVEHGADGRVRRFPELFEVIFLLPLQIWRDGCALDADMQALDCLCCLYGDGVFCFVAVLDGKIVIFTIQFHEGKNQLVFDHAPEDVCHFIAVELGNGVLHFDFFHGYSLLCAA